MAPNVALTDIGEDISLALSKQTDQQADMAEFMSGLQDGTIMFILLQGHSLVRNLAMYGAITLENFRKLAECKTFNASGFNSEFHTEYEKEIAAVAVLSANNYENTYSLLTKVISGDIYKQDGEVSLVFCVILVLVLLTIYKSVNLIYCSVVKLNIYAL